VEVLDFRFIALFQNHNTPKVTWVENRGQISHFLTPQNLAVGWAKRLGQF